MKTLKNLVKSFIPSKVLYAVAKVKALKNAHLLFNGDDALFKAAFDAETVYGEYGCGESTIWVSNSTGCEIFSVDSSAEWIDFVYSKCNQAKRPTLHWADVGPIGEWGRPLGYTRLENFNDYTDWLWKNDKKPNLILVDGRFRVCSFLTCLIYAEEGVKIFFDDYTNRTEYHLVEKFIKPTETYGRQALFVTPKRETLDINGIKEAIGKFRFVFD